MSAKSRSVSQQLARIKDPAKRENFLESWLDDISELSRKITYNLESAVERGDLEMVAIQARQLRELTEKKIFVIKKVMKKAYAPHKIKLWQRDKLPNQSLGALIVNPSDDVDGNILIGVNDFSDGEWDSPLGEGVYWAKETDVLEQLDFESIAPRD